MTSIEKVLFSNTILKNIYLSETDLAQAQFLKTSKKTHNLLNSIIEGIDILLEDIKEIISLIKYLNLLKKETCCKYKLQIKSFFELKKEKYNDNNFKYFYYFRIYIFDKRSRFISKWLK